jgi:hypothetical protein
MTVPSRLDHLSRRFRSQRGLLVGSREAFLAEAVRRAGIPTSSSLQREFDAMLAEIAETMGTERIPVFLQLTEPDELRRLDKGRIGHAVANHTLELITDDEGYVSHVRRTASVIDQSI